MSTKLPYFPFFADDFFSGVADLTDEEVGVYVKLLCLAWSKDGLTERTARVASRSDEAIGFVLKEKFYQDETGKWRNDRQEQVRKRQISLQERGSRGGKSRASKPDEDDSEADGQADGVANGQADGQANGVAKAKPHIHIQNHIQDPAPETKSKTPPLSPPEGDRSKGISVDEFFERWNAFAEKTPKLSSCRKLTTKRREKIAARLKADGWFEDFREAVNSLPLPGDGWQPGLDWLIRNDHNIYLVLEGEYDWRGKDDPASQRVAQQRRKNSLEQREREEEWRKQQHKQEARGLRSAISNTLPASTGSGQEEQDASLLFE